jgi:hypothetical protein
MKPKHFLSLFLFLTCAAAFAQQAAPPSAPPHPPAAPPPPTTQAAPRPPSTPIPPVATPAPTQPAASSTPATQPPPPPMVPLILHDPSDQKTLDNLVREEQDLQKQITDFVTQGNAQLKSWQAQMLTYQKVAQDNWGADVVYNQQTGKFERPASSVGKDAAAAKKADRRPSLPCDRPDCSTAPAAPGPKP